jgi:predicted metalloprotease with PDZ domain
MRIIGGEQKLIIIFCFVFFIIIILKCKLSANLKIGHECEDGSLGCFVTFVSKAGPADVNNIEVGDQILEFNGHSLIDSTYEEVRTLQNNSGDYVQLVVQHNNIRLKMGTSNSPMEVSRHFETVPRLCQSQMRKRRNLPPLPTPPINQVSVEN